jgi:hypothetical protein
MIHESTHIKLQPMFLKQPYLHPLAFILCNSPLFAVTQNTSINHLTLLCLSFFSLRTFSHTTTKKAAHLIFQYISRTINSILFILLVTKSFVCLWKYFWTSWDIIRDNAASRFDIERDTRLGGTPLILTLCQIRSFGYGMCLVFILHKIINNLEPV